jgi:hypothetical protein
MKAAGALVRIVCSPARRIPRRYCRKLDINKVSMRPISPLFSSVLSTRKIREGEFPDRDLSAAPQVDFRR